MSAKFCSFFMGMLLFMTYGLTHLHHAPNILNSASTAYAEDDDSDFDEPDEIADELDDVTEEEEIVEDADEANEEQEEEVIEEIKKI